MTVTRFGTIAIALGLSALGSVAWLSTTLKAEQSSSPSATLADPQAQVAHEAAAAALAEAGQAGNVARVLRVLGEGGSRIGVSIRDLNDEDTKAGRTSGAVIDDVNEDSPAAKGGLKAGDVVTSFDGERVRSARQFTRLVEETPSGRSVKAQVLRNGASVDLSVTPQAPEPMRMGRAGDNQHFEFFRGPEQGQAFEWRSDEPGPRLRFRREGPMPTPGPGGPMLHMMPGGPGMPGMPGELMDLDVQVSMGKGRLGVGVQALTPELAEYFGVKEGVLVTSVQKDGAAAKAGVKVGDIITTVDGTSIDDPAELRRRVWKDGAAADLALGISRDKKAQTLKVQLPAAEAEDRSTTGDKVKIEKQVIKRKV